MPRRRDMSHNQESAILINQIIKTVAVAAVAVFVIGIPSVSDSQNAALGNHLNSRLYVGEVELSPPNFRSSKAFHFTVLNSGGAFVGCGTGPGARPSWYYVERCKANDLTCNASVDSMFQLLMSAKLSRLPISIQAPNCKVEILHLW